MREERIEDYLLDCLEQSGAYGRNREEQQQLERGIRLFLWENGIREGETRPYFRRYVDAHLRRVAPEDRLRYFLLYPQIRQVRQLAAEYRADGSLPPEKQKCLYRCMEELYRQGLGERYVPTAELAELLGLSL